MADDFEGEMHSLYLYPYLWQKKCFMSSLFRNLIFNAIKHRSNPDNNHVHLTAGELGNLYEFQVKDNGSSIA